MASGLLEARPARRGERGFTLVELLVALTITVIGLAGLLSLHVVTLKGNQAASRVGEGTTIGQRAIEELRELSIDQITTTFGALPINQAVYDTEIGRAGMNYTILLSIDQLTVASPDLVRMRIDVQWTDDGAVPGSENGRYDHQLSFELIRTRQEAL